MIQAIFTNHDGSKRVINWHAVNPKKSMDPLDGKSIKDLLNDFGAKSCNLINYDKPERNNKRGSTH